MKKLSLFLFFYYSPIRRLIGISILSTLFITHYSFGQWMWINPIPHGNDIYSISFVNNNTGWMFGGLVQNLKTTNKGINWINTNFIGEPTIYVSKVFNFDSQNSAFWLGANLGRLYKSIDSGKSFQLINLPTTNIVKNIFFLNKDTGYVVATQLYKTTNSGINWTSIFNPSFEIFCVNFLNDSLGYCSGTSYFSSTSSGGHWLNYIYKTINSGNNWSGIYSHDFSEVIWAKDIYFKDTITGLFSGTAKLYSSSSGGSNWTDIGLGGILKKTRNNIFYRTGDYQLQKSTNFGVNWSLMSDVNIDATCLENIDSTNFFIGGYYGNIIKTTNAGINWSNYCNSFTSESINKIMLNDSNNIYILAGASLLKSTNSGANFITVNTNSYNQKPIKSVWFVNSNTGWIGSDSGRIFRTTNGGNNWNLISVGANDIKSIHVLSSGVGYFLSLSLRIYKTTNFGENWISLGIIGGSIEGMKIQFLNNQTGYLTAVHSIYKTTNGGQQWYVVHDSYVEDVYFANSNKGYQIVPVSYYPPNYTRKIYRTTDGCNTWTEMLSDVNIRTIYCADTNIVYAGALGKLYKSTNSGSNWEQETITTNYLYSISSYKKTLWLGGEAGNIIKGIDKVPVGINSNNEQIADRFELFQNYPNPFNPSTNIRYQIPKSVNGQTSNVKLIIFDILGKEIATLVNEKQSPGTYEVSWDGSAFPSGVYFYKLTAGDFTETKKMLMIK